MILFLFGIIIGSLLTFFFYFIYLFIFEKKKRIEYLFKEVNKEIGGEIGLPIGKTEFISPVEEQAEAIADIIQENDKKGIDTKIE